MFLKQAGLTGPDQELPVPVRVKHGSNRAGKDAALLLELLERSTETPLTRIIPEWTYFLKRPSPMVSK